MNAARGRARAGAWMLAAAARPAREVLRLVAAARAAVSRRTLRASPAALLVLAAAASPLLADTPSAVPADPPQMRHLDGDRYQLGNIIVDKAGRTFSVPGVILELGSPEAPLEFLAAARKGVKLYESLIELDTGAVDFNVACILIGLEAARGRPAAHHFDPQPVSGDTVNVAVEWQQDGRMVRRSAAELIRTSHSDPPRDDWVYTGSVIAPDGRFMAQADGVLVGFVHAPESIIEHRTGLGLGNYGEVRYDPRTTPPAGTAVRLVVEKP